MPLALLWIAALAACLAEPDSGPEPDAPVRAADTPA